VVDKLIDGVPLAAQTDMVAAYKAALAEITR